MLKILKDLLQGKTLFDYLPEEPPEWYQTYLEPYQAPEPEMDPEEEELWDALFGYDAPPLTSHSTQEEEG